MKIFTKRTPIKASGRSVVFPFLVEGEFADGFTCEVSGQNEAECVEALGDMQDKHGELVWYSGVTDEYYENGRRIESSTKLGKHTVKAGKSLNMGAKPRWEEWVAYGYDVNGEDVTTSAIEFQGNFKQLVTDLFRYPEIDTVDVYKRSSSENDEYFQTFTREDVRDMLADAVWDIQHGDVESSVCASTSNKIPYDMVSILVILRDYANVEDEDYINNEHKLLVDIADTLYNVGRRMVTNLSGEYKNLYEMYGEDYFDKVLDDVTAIDSQMSDQNLNDLIEDYNNRIAAY